LLSPFQEDHNTVHSPQSSAPVINFQTRGRKMCVVKNVKDSINNKTKIKSEQNQ
jgi:hypothetical protein